ncbi:MAG TPA: hypothetical protein VHC22_26015 [Pirellulales bacterium]|nr:hypothetical protein [Pirellulales bacterium]
MSATKRASILQTLELDAAIIESLPEPVLSELIGFIEYDNRLDREEIDADDSVGQAACCPASATWPDD